MKKKVLAGRVMALFIILMAGCSCKHKFDKGRVTIESTCKMNGVMTYTCTLCGEERKEFIALKEHEKDEGTVSREATFETEGLRVFECKICGDIFDKEIIPVRDDEVTVTDKINLKETTLTPIPEATLTPIPKATATPQPLSENKKAYEALSSLEYYMDIISTSKNVLDTGCKLVENATTVNKKLSYCDEVIDTIFSIAKYLEEVIDTCSEYEELRWLCETCMIDVPIFTEISSYMTEAKAYSAQVGFVLDAYSALCDYYGGEKTKKPSIDDIVIKTSTDVVTVGEESQTLDVMIIDNGYENYKIGISYVANSWIECGWGEWNGDSIPLIISTTGNGETTIRITIKDSSVYKDIKVISHKR